MFLKSFFTVIALSALIFTSCNNEKNEVRSSNKSSPKSRAEAAKKLKIQAELEKQQAEEKIAAEAEAERIAAEKEAEKIEAQKLADEELAEKQLQAELAELEIRTAAQKAAWANYIGTKYDTLKLENGKTLTNAKVSEVRPTHVTFMHSAGIANIKFIELSPSIRTTCKYDPELAAISKKKQAELQRKIRTNMAYRRIAQEKRAKSFTDKTSANNNSSYKKEETTKKEVRPFGSISVRIKNIDTDGIRDYGYKTRTRRDGLRKTIEISAYSNVPAILSVNGSSYRVTPKVNLIQSVN